MKLSWSVSFELEQIYMARWTRVLNRLSWSLEELNDPQRVYIFTQPVRSGRIWHKVIFLSGV